MRKQAASFVLALALCLGLAVPATAAGGEPAHSSNFGQENYTRASSPVNSYLYENPSGGLTRVEYITGDIIVEDYDNSFVLQSSRNIPRELPTWGGFFAGEDYNFLIFGQSNPTESNDVEVIRVVKYDKDWNRLGHASLYGANTTIPFRSGSLRCDEYGGYLYIRTSHQMYASSDGLNHQANLTMAVQQSDMTVTDSFYGIMNINYGYVSHSFNQFILVNEDGCIVALDHGDAYPRGVVLCRYSADASTGKFTGTQCSSDMLIDFPGAIGDNTTGASVGGLAETTDCYIVAYNYDGAGKSNSIGDRYPYFQYINKATGQGERIQIDLPGSATPMLAPTGLDGGYMLWNVKVDSVFSNISNTLYYLPYAADGTLGQLQTAEARLSDCQPIYYQGQVVWYTTRSSSVPTFYTLDESGVTAHIANQANQPAADPAVPTYGTAYTSTQNILVDGRSVEFQAYALLDADGNPTNYVKLRDVASVLNGTAAQFEVSWDGDVNILTRHAYTPNGSEMFTPFSGNRAYTVPSAVTKVNGQPAALDAIVLTDDDGGAYTYYKLRDLGAALGFTVDWDGEKGMAFIETK